MKRTLFLLICIVTLNVNVQGQFRKSNHYTYKIDTLINKSDSIFANILSYNSGTLVGEKKAFIFLDSIKIHRFRLTKSILTKKIYVVRILRHGKCVEYVQESGKSIEEYSYGNLLSTRYYDLLNNEISKEQFMNDKLITGPGRDKNWEYLIIENKVIIK